MTNDYDLLDWVNENVSFPNSMVDRITPATVDSDRHNLQANFGIEDEWPVVCESFIQWFIEDDFKAMPRAPWELVGAEYVADVVPYENMKLQLLNAGHTVLGILGKFTLFIKMSSPIFFFKCEKTKLKGKKVNFLISLKSII